MLDKFFRTIEKIVPAKYRWVLNHDGFKRYFANTGWMFFGQMFSLLVSFFIVAWMARYLGPENYGVLSYALAFSGIFSFAATLGIDGILIRELVKFPKKRDLLMGTAFRLKVIGGFVALGLSVVSVVIFESNPLIKLLVTICSISFIIQTINVVSFYFQAEVKSVYNAKSLVAATIISALLKITVIYFDKGVIWITIVYVLDSLWLGIGFVTYYYKLGLRMNNWRFDKTQAFELLRNSWPLMLASAAGLIYLKIDQIIIGGILGNREVGIYAAAVRLVEVWYFIPGIICGSLFPAIINAKKTNEAVYRKRLKSFYVLMMVIPILIAIPVTILSRPITLILFGDGFLESVNILRIYIWSCLGFFLTMAVSQYLMSENLVKTIFWLNFLVMAINIILNFVFIPRLGLAGSAIATLVSCFIIPVLIFSVKDKIWIRIG